MESILEIASEVGIRLEKGLGSVNRVKSGVIDPVCVQKWYDVE